MSILPAIDYRETYQLSDVVSGREVKIDNLFKENDYVYFKDSSPEYRENLIMNYQLKEIEYIGETVTDYLNRGGKINKLPYIPPEII